MAARSGDGDDEADGDEAQAHEDEGRARALAVREPGHDDGQNGGGDVNGSEMNKDKPVSETASMSNEIAGLFTWSGAGRLRTCSRVR